MLLNWIEVLPWFVAVTVCGALLVPTFCLPNFRLPGETFTAVALPVRSTNCGFVDALSIIVTTPLKVPVLFGLNVALIVQLFPANTELPQVVFIWNGPDSLIELIERVAVPLLVRFTLCS